MNFCLLYLKSHLLKPSSVLSSDTLGYAVGKICASKPKVYFSLMHYTPTVRGQGTLYHGHSGTQTEKAATILNIASHHGWEKENSGGVSCQQWMPPPRSDPHHFLSQPSASTSDMASPNQQGAGKHSSGECSPTTCLESQARNTWQTGLTITPHPLRSFPCCPRQSCCVTSSPLGTFCVFFGHDNDHIAL